MRKIFISILIFFISATYLYADIVWRNIGSEINSREFNCVAVDIFNPNIVYVGTANGAYKTEDGGISWERIFTGWRGRKNVRDVYIKDDKVFLCTDRGLFISRDGGKKWHPSFGMASRSRILSIAMLDGDMPIIFIATDRGLFKSLSDKRAWKRVFSAEDDDRHMEDEENNDIVLPNVRSITTSFSHPSRLYIGTEDGVYMSEDNGESFRRFEDEGLLDREILFLSESPVEPDRLYAVTKVGVFYFSDGWHRFELASPLKDVNSIAFDINPKDSIWVATKRGVYKSARAVTDEERAEIETTNLLSYFNNEPTINEVQERAIRYAEVHPEKIAKWRRRASAKAILPRLSFGIDRSESDTYEIYTSSSKQYSVIGPRKTSDGWDITLTWDLGDLIWNGDQTLIDVRSKLMVQLRDDILDEVTSYYFERRKLQIELLEAPPKSKRDRIKKDLRIQELTANIDALTGGYFSKRLKDSN